ncbi:uncharacterized protein [Chanodichthys erythropterus]
MYMLHLLKSSEELTPSLHRCWSSEVFLRGWIQTEADVLSRRASRDLNWVSESEPQTLFQSLGAKCENALPSLVDLTVLGVFVADAVKSESVTEGESVSLNSSFTQIHRDEEIEWKFRNILIASVMNNKSKFYDESAEGRFRDRLKLDHQTGSLTIINSRTTDSGLYTVSRDTTINTINLTVYAHLPVPVISSNSSLNSSSSSSCSLVCSAVNVSHVTLSWFKGNSVFSSIRVSDLSSRSDLLLHLECVDDSYSCVLNNPIRNQTQHLNNTQLCHTCAAVHCCGFTEAVIRLALSALVGVATVAVLVYDIRSRSVFVADAVKSESVTEGESVSLNSSFTQIHRDEEIEWKFAEFLIARVKNKESVFYSRSAEGRFRDRLKLDHQTGSLTIINSRTTDSGLYTVSRDTTINTINLTVYARLPVPVISRDSSQCSSSSCSLVCSSVVNVSHVTLSWFKGNSSFSSIRASDLSISLSLPLEVEYQDNNTYSCVINNPISHQTRHLNITQLCQPCASGVSSLNIGLISAAAAGSLLIVAVVGIFCICRKTHQEGKYSLLLRYLYKYKFLKAQYVSFTARSHDCMRSY